MEFRIEKRTVGGVITYQPQVLLEHPSQPEIAMWTNLIKIVNEIKVGAIYYHSPNSITISGEYQTWDSIPQAKSVIDIYAKKKDSEKVDEIITEYIPYEPKS